MKSRKSKKIVKYAIYVGAIVLVVTASVSFLSYRFYNQRLIEERTKYSKELQAEQQKVNKYEKASRIGWVLEKDKEAGDIIGESDIKQMLLPDYFTPENLIVDRENVIGKVIKINVLKATAVTNEMVYENGQLDPSERKEEVQYIRLPLKIQVNDTVDIRIVFPNGEDYIVVAKKKIDDVDVTNQNAFFKDNEEEAMLLQAALVDAYINDAEIYMKQYTEPEMQDAPMVTYVPNKSVINAIKNNPQIVEQARWKQAADIRKNLELRLEAIDIEDKIRIGAGSPMGSAVAKRKKDDGAVYMQGTNTPVNDSGTALGVNGIVNQPITPTNNGSVGSTVDSSQAIKGTTGTTDTTNNTVPTTNGVTDSSTVYPEPNLEIPDVTTEESTPNLLGGE